MEKFKDKYRIPSARATWWDYKSAAAYFITICTHHRYPYFGRIENGKMLLSEIGEVAKSEWERTFEIRNDMNLTKAEYVIMPNHFHAIIHIGENEFQIQHQKTGQPNNQFSPQSRNLASIVRGFKSSVTKRALTFNSDFKWQTRFHDHIIKTNKSYERISQYIRLNPILWKDDKFYPGID